MRPSCVRLNQHSEQAPVIETEEEVILETETSDLVESESSIFDVSLEDAMKALEGSDIEQNPKFQHFNSLLNEIVFRDQLQGSNMDSQISQNAKRFPFLESTPSTAAYSEQELHLRNLYHKKLLGKLGSNVTNVYNPKKDIKNPTPVSKIAINTLMSAGCHLGHSTSLWRPSTQPFIYGEYKGIHIIDLEQTLTYLKKAAKIVQGVAERNGIIVFVGTRKGQRDSLVEAARRTGGFYVSSKWIQGTITNAVKTSENWRRKEVDMEDVNTERELGADELTSLVKPDLIVILNPLENRRCIKEAMLTRIPTIGLVDTDSEASLLTYPIPCNDDSLRATNLIAGVLSKAGEAGRLARLERMREYKKSLGVIEGDSGLQFTERT